MSGTLWAGPANFSDRVPFVHKHRGFNSTYPCMSDFNNSDVPVWGIISSSFIHLFSKKVGVCSSQTQTAQFESVWHRAKYCAHWLGKQSAFLTQWGFVNLSFRSRINSNVALAWYAAVVDKISHTIAIPSQGDIFECGKVCYKSRSMASMTTVDRSIWQHWSNQANQILIFDMFC